MRTAAATRSVAAIPAVSLEAMPAAKLVAMPAVKRAAMPAATLAAMPAARQVAEVVAAEVAAAEVAAAESPDRRGNGLPTRPVPRLWLLHPHRHKPWRHGCCWNYLGYCQR